MVAGPQTLNAAKEPNNWLMYGREYFNTRFSPRNEITPRNARKLIPKWNFQFGVLDGQTTTPVVNNGVMYATSSGVTCSRSMLEPESRSCATITNCPRISANIFAATP